MSRLAAGLSTLFAAILLLIHLQPTAYPNIREAYFPADCAQPCFVDVRPGTSTVAEAMTSLDQNVSHGAFLEAEIQYLQNNQVRYQRVNWSGYLFYPLQGIGRVDLPINAIDTGNRLISALFVRPHTPLELGDIYANLGAPDSIAYGVWYHDLGTRTSLILHLQYDGGQVTFVTRHLCPVDWNGFWHTPVVSVRYSQTPLPLLTTSDLNTIRAITDCRNIIRR